MQRGREALRAQYPDDPSLFDDYRKNEDLFLRQSTNAADPGREEIPTEGGPSLFPVLSHPAPAPRGGVVSGRGAWYPDLVPNNIVQSTPVPIKISDVFKNKTDISIGRARYYIAVVGTRKPRDFCGNVRTLAKACPEKPGEHPPTLLNQTCGRRVCDTCWDTWGMRAAERINDKHEGYLVAKWGDPKQYTEEERDAMLPRHISFHPPDFVLEKLVEEISLKCEHEEQFSRMFIYEFRRLCEDMVMGAGSYAGTMFIHEIRLKDEVRCDTELSTNRYRSVLKKKDWIYKIKYYPHCHCMAYGPIEDAATFHARTGWTYRNHSTKGPIRDPVGLAFYLLSHGIATDGVDSYSYYGEMSPRRLVKIGERVFHVPEECEFCKQEGALGSVNRVISIIYGPSLKFANEGNRDALLRFGSGPPVQWGFDIITERVFFKAVHIGEYRLLPPKTRWRKPRWRHVGLDKEALDHVLSGGSDDPWQGFWFAKGQFVRGWASLDDENEGVWISSKDWCRMPRGPDFEDLTKGLEVNQKILRGWFS